MAEKISKEIFTPLGWRTIPPHNVDWQCVTPEHQTTKGRGTHPSDVVYRYEDPYSNQTIFINTDLKSYGKNTITKYKIIEAINDLSKSTDCARRSADWQSKYIPEGVPATTIGLLFIYNHDNEYESEFEAVLQGIEQRSIDIAPELKIFVFGPSDINHALNLVHDMKNLAFDGLFTHPNECLFFYPHLIRRRARIQHTSALTIQAFTAPWQVYTFKRPQPADKTKGLVIYGRGRGESVDEFKYIFDYLFRYQLIDEDTEIHLRLPNAVLGANSICKAAVETYAYGIPMGTHIHSLLSQIKFEKPNTIVAQFSALQIGMSDD